MPDLPQFCSQCGSPLPAGSRFCGTCGRPLAEADPPRPAAEATQPLPPAPATPLEPSPAPQELAWEVNVPLLTDQFIMYDLLKVWGLSSGFVIGLVSAIFLWEGNRERLVPMLLPVGLTCLGILVLFLLVMLVFFGNRFPMGFVLNDKGAMTVSLSRRGRWGNRLAVILGALAGRPGVAGAGLLAMSRESVGVSWDEVERLQIHPQTRVISLMDSWHVVLRLYCTPQNYPQVAQAVQQRTRESIARAAARPPSRGLGPILNFFLKSLGAVFAAYCLTALPLEVPRVCLWLLLAAGLGAMWLLPWRRFLGSLTLLLAAVVLGIFISQGLEVHQRTDPEKFKAFARSQGLEVTQVPDWLIGRHRAFQGFHGDDWLLTGVGLAGLSFFIWVGVRALRGREQNGVKSGKTKTGPNDV